MSDTMYKPIDSAAAARGSASDAASPSMRSPEPLIPTRGWVWIVVLGALFIGLHLTYLERLFRIVTTAEGDSFWELFRSAMTGPWNPDWSHALVIPLISLYFLYLWRDQLIAAPVRTCWWGLAILCFGLLSYTWWIFPGRNDMLQGYSMIIALFGLVLFLLGEKVMKVAWFPIVYLVFAVKISNQIWEQIAATLQNIASAISYVALQFCALVIDFEPTRSGNTISLTFMKNGQLVHESMNVAEACSGLRMLMAFIALGAALAFITPRPWWQRLLMLAVAVPVAIAVNVGRVTAIGLLYLVNPEYARGDFHTFVGLLMLIPAALLILLIGWCANRIFIPDPTASAEPRDGEPAMAKPAPAPVTPTLATRTCAAVVGKGAAAGVVLALLLGGAYAGMWWFSTTAVAEPLPHRVLMLVMMGMILLSALGVALVGRGVLKVAATRPGSRLPLAASMVAGLLAVTWMGQQSAIAYTQVVLIKKAVPTRLHLMMVPQQIGPWRMLSDESDRMTKEVIEALGTTNFISRYYVNTDLHTLEEVRRLPLSQIKPGAIARLHVAYYTGNPDTVPHVPDRCYLAGGADFLDRRIIDLELDESKFIPDPDGGYLAFVPSGLALESRLPDVTIPATRFTYLARDDGDPESVIYFFLANGKYFSTPYEVRALGFDPRDEYAYYCKVEVSLVGVADTADNERQTAAFLEQCLPEILACLPDWRDVTEGRWPEPDARASAGPQAPSTPTP